MNPSILFSMARPLTATVFAFLSVFFFFLVTDGVFSRAEGGDENRRGRVAVNQGCRGNGWFYESLQTFFTFNEKRQQFSSRQRNEGDGGVEDECGAGKERKRKGRGNGQENGIKERGKSQVGLAEELEWPETLRGKGRKEG